MWSCFSRLGIEGPSKGTAPSSSSIKTRISSEIPGAIFVDGDSCEESRLYAEIQCAILYTRPGKKSRVAFSLVAILLLIVRGGSDSSGTRGRKNSLKQSLVLPTPRKTRWRKATAGQHGERCFQACPTSSRAGRQRARVRSESC